MNSSSKKNQANVITPAASRLLTRRAFLLGVPLAGAMLGAYGTQALGQTGSLLIRRAQPAVAIPNPPGVAPLRTAQVSFIQAPEPVPFRVHDLITIEVDESMRHQPNARANRRRQASYELSFDDLIVLLGGLRIRADQAIRDQQPSVDFQTLYNIQVQAQSGRTDVLTFVMTAEVAEIQPNGNLVLEANARVQVNNEVIDSKLSGVCNPADVNPVTRNINSERIANKQVFVHQLGPTRDVMRRGFLLRFLDMFRLI